MLSPDNQSFSIKVFSTGTAFEVAMNRAMLYGLYENYLSYYSLHPPRLQLREQ